METDPRLLSDEDWAAYLRVAAQGRTEPRVLSGEEWAAYLHLAEQNRRVLEARALAARDFAEAAGTYPHGARLAALVRFNVRHRLSDDEWRAALRATWTIEHAPGMSLPRRQLIAMFRRVGYFADAPAPSASVPLYRGAPVAFRRGLAWTGERRVADFFAHRTGGLVWAARVPPRRILARFAHDRAEDEYVVDPSGLTIIAAGF
jgi:hypothetical protein